MSIPKHPFTLKTVTVVLKSKKDPTKSWDFSNHITSLMLQPSSATPTGVVTGRKFVGETDWTANLGLVQDLDANGFLRWTIEEEGEEMTMVATFADGSDPLEVDLTVVASSIGGNASDSTVAQSSVSMPCSGKPRWLPAPPPGEGD